MAHDGKPFQKLSGKWFAKTNCKSKGERGSLRMLQSELFLHVLRKPLLTRYHGTGCRVYHKVKAWPQS